MTQESNRIKENLENIQGFKKHGTNISRMKWADYAKGSVKGKMELVKEWKEKILFMSSDRQNKICYTSLVCEVIPGKNTQIVKKI